MNLPRIVLGTCAISTILFASATAAFAEQVTVGPMSADLCADCYPSSYTLASPEGPVEVVLIRPLSSAGETVGASYVTLSWYANGVRMGDRQLDAEGVRDLVANSVAASIGGTTRNFEAGTLQIGDDSVTAVAVTSPAGITARSGAITHDGGILVVTSVIRPAEPAVAPMTAMLQTIAPANAQQGEE